MPRGANPKREREYEELKQKFKNSGRYKGRETQVAARIVNKQRAEYGETKAEKKKDSKGESPDRNLPIESYQHKTIAQLQPQLTKLSTSDLNKIERYESSHKDRKGIHQAIKRAKAA